MEVGHALVDGHVAGKEVGECQGGRNLLVARTEGRAHLGTSVRVVSAVCSPVRPVHYKVTAIEILEGYHTISTLMTLGI